MTMRADLVLFRTQKGEDILLSHGREISTNQRRALLVVNGKTGIAELAKTVFWVTDMTVTLQELLALGLVSDSPSASDMPGSPASAESQLTKVMLAAMARELLGDSAERIIKKVEEAEDTPEALEQVLAGCKKLIKLTISEEMADTFLQRGLKLLGK